MDLPYKVNHQLDINEISEMDPINITVATINLVQAISSTYNAIQHLKGLPKAFKEVGQELSLVKETLDLVHSQLQASTLDESTQKAIEPILRSCQEKTIALNEIFQEIDKRKKNDKEVKDWSALVNSYRTMMLRLGKAHRVEVLMQGILNGLRGLAVNQLFKLATKAQMGKLEEAIQKLSEVEPSIPDSDFEPNSTSFTQNVSEGGKGNMFNSVGGPQTNKFGHEFHATGNQNFGMDFMNNLMKDFG
ncbi:hypothetical protein N431DRAFT_160884 [Stipitochalara longipes BDJ]|nr:hypothetical protein N431DRAFT_160884 [Stipitochalara longipes BDJ]